MRDRAISSKFSTHRVSKQCTIGNFPLPKNGGHFEFSNFRQKRKTQIASISITMRDRGISSKLPTGYLSKLLFASFKKFYSSKMAAYFEFSNYCQKCKNRNLQINTSISLTVRDRVISSKFSTHRVSKQCTLGNFQKNFLSKNEMAAMLNFRIFSENRKTQICFYLLNRAR